MKEKKRQLFLRLKCSLSNKVFPRHSIILNCHQSSQQFYKEATHIYKEDVKLGA